MPLRSRFVSALLPAATLLLPAAAAAAKIQVVSTLTNPAALAAAIGGDRVEVFSLAKGYQDPHFVDAKPSLVLRLSRADLLLVTGLGMEAGYLPPLLDQSRNAKIRPGAPGYLDVSVGCDILQRPTQQVTRAQGDVHPFGNPHYWLDPANGRVMARTIAARLARIDAEGAPHYQRNLAAFERRLTEKAAEWQRRVAPFAGTKVVTFHNSWPNFARAFGLEIVGHVEPKPGIPPSPTHTLATINLVRSQPVPLIVVEPYFDTKTPDFIAAKSGAKVLTLYPSVGGIPEIHDYIALFDVNLDLLVAALAESR